MLIDQSGYQMPRFSLTEDNRCNLRVSFATHAERLMLKKKREREREGTKKSQKKMEELDTFCN